MLIEIEPGVDWRDLQQRVAAILQESGLVVEVARLLRTARGTVEIDVYATDPTTAPPAIYLCECKRWRSNVPQAEVQTFRTIVSDAGAHFGLFISATDFQDGAFEVVKHTNVHLLNWQRFQYLFIERWCRTYWVPTFRTIGDRLAGYVDPVSSDAASRESQGGHIEPAEAVGLFVLDMYGDPFNNMTATMLGQPQPPVMEAICSHRERHRKYLPKAVAKAESLRELLDALLSFIKQWKQSRGI